MDCLKCNSPVSNGKFCQECGTQVQVTLPVDEDPGAQVTRWHTLRQELETAREMSRALEAEMDTIAVVLKRDHSLQLPVQAEEVTPPAVSSEPMVTLSASSETPAEQDQPPDDAAKAGSTGETRVMLEGTRTGPRGGVDHSGSAAEKPVGPSDEAVKASHGGTVPPQRAVGTLEDDHEGKVDPKVDEARTDSGVRQGESPLDDPGQFQRAVSATIRKAVDGK